jgi:hypothetical protein
MMYYKDLLGYLATAIALAGYIPYFRDIFRNKTKPHAFSWLVWAVLTGIAFAAQVVGGGGAGAWVTGFSAFVCFTVFLLALKKGQKTFSRFDWISLLSAFGALLLWVLTNNPVLSVLLVTAIDAIGFLPTFRKGYHNPFEETVSTFLLSSVKWVFAIFALNTFSILTWFYPASLILMNGLFVVLLLVRRKRLKMIAD